MRMTSWPGAFLLATWEASQWGPAPPAAEPLGTSQLLGCSSTSTARPGARRHWPSLWGIAQSTASLRCCAWSGWPPFAKWSCPFSSALNLCLHREVRVASLLGLTMHVPSYSVKLLWFRKTNVSLVWGITFVFLSLSSRNLAARCTNACLRHT